jgi:hypothetical protein
MLLALPAHAVDLDVVVGFAQAMNMPARYRPGDWTPVTVFVHGPGANGQAELQLSASFGGHSAVYTRRIALHDGPNSLISRFAICPAEGPYWVRNSAPEGLTASLLLDGRKIAEKSVTLPAPIDPAQFGVLALTPDQSGLTLLARKQLGLKHREANPNPYRQPGMDPDMGPAILYADPLLLPEMHQGYASLDAVVFGDIPPDALTEPQQQALKEYVRRGGLLVVTGGPDTARLKAGVLAELLPVRPEGAAPASLSPLARRYGAAVPGRSEVLCTEGKVGPDSRILLPGLSPRSPLVTARPYGSGTIVFVAFDPSAPEFRSWRAAPQFWKDLLSCGDRTIDPARSIHTADQVMPWMTMGRYVLADALAGARASRAPPWYGIAIFLAAYILLLVPISYFILKRLDRRELAWITAPVLIVLFTVGSYVAASTYKGGLLSANRAVVVDGSAGSDLYSGYGMLTIYAPARGRLDVDAGAPDRTGALEAAPDELWSRDSGTNPIEVDMDAGGVMRGVPVRLWDTRSFGVPLAPSLGGAIKTTTKRIKERVYRLRVTNGTHLLLRDCRALFGSESREIGDLAPGASGETTIRWDEPVQTNSLSLPASAAPSGGMFNPQSGDTPDESRARIQQGMVSALGTQENEYGGYGSPPGLTPHAVIGWCYDDLMPVRIDGREALGEEVNFIFVRIPTPPDVHGKAAQTANPFRARPVSWIKDVERRQPVNMP